MKNKKAVFIIPNLQGNGAEKFVLTMYRALEEYQNYECHILCLNNTIEYNLDHSTRLHILNLPKPRNMFKKIFKRKIESKYIEKYILDNIGIPSLTLSNLTSADKVVKYFKLPNTYHVIHSTTSIEHLKLRKGFKRWLATKKINSIYSNHECICVSKGVKEDLDVNFSLKPKSHVIYNPVNKCDIEQLAKNSVLPSLEGALLPDNFLIHIGKFNDAKRHDRLINAYAKSNISEKLLLVGKGSKLNKMKELVKQLKIEEKVIFWGYTPNPYPLLKRAKGLVLSSDYEGLSYVLLEAICLQIPIISTNCPSGPSEVLIDRPESLCGLSIKSLACKIQQLSKNPESLKHDFNDIFSMENSAKEYNKFSGDI